MMMGIPDYSYITIIILLMVLFSCVVQLVYAVSPEKISDHDQRVAPLVFFAIALFMVIQFFVQILPEFKPYAFADDWIYSKPLDFKSFSQWVDFAFSQHVDHRIPIQKLSNFFVLKAFGFDFRSIVGLNYIMAFMASLMLIYVARVYRGRSSVGDLIIPLGIMHFSAGYTLWGFQFQFLSSIFFVACFTFFATRFTQNSKSSNIVLAAVSLLACALCGINGLLFATVITAGISGWFLINQAENKVPRLTFLIIFVLEVILWLNWTRSDATHVEGLNAFEFFRYTFNLLPSSMGVFAFDGIPWKSGLILLFFIPAMILIALRLLKRVLTLRELILALVAVSSFVVMLSVAVGRSKVQGSWSSGVAMHYGSMSIFMPVMSWMIISKSIQSRASSVAGVVLTLVFLAAYVTNLDWREGVISGARAHQKEIVDALQSGESSQAVMERFYNDFSVGEENKPQVVKGIDAFRAAGSKLYGP